MQEKNLFGVHHCSSNKPHDKKTLYLIVFTNERCIFIQINAFKTSTVIVCTCVLFIDGYRKSIMLLNTVVLLSEEISLVHSALWINSDCAKEPSCVHLSVSFLCPLNYVEFSGTKGLCKRLQKIMFPHLWQNNAKLVGTNILSLFFQYQEFACRMTFLPCIINIIILSRSVQTCKYIFNEVLHNQIKGKSVAQLVALEWIYM